MTLPTADEILLAKASAMAASDGEVLSQLYIVAATNTLIIELSQARDRILSSPPAGMRLAGAAHPADPATVAAQDIGAEIETAAMDIPAPVAEEPEAPATGAAEESPATEAASASDVSE